MCFSAGASFTSGVVLAVAGGAALKQTAKKSEMLFASIPLIFAIQQFTEGFLWLALKEKIDPSWQVLLTHLFIFIAQAVWPFFVPLSIWFLEEQPKRKKVLFVITGMGLCIFLSVTYRLLFYPVSSSIEGHHIVYDLEFPVAIHYLGAATYFVATVISAFISSVKRMYLLGLTILFSYIGAAIFFTRYVISVWCFFAALISTAIYFIIKEQKKHSHTDLNHKISDYQL